MAGKDIEEGEGIPLEKSSSETPRPTLWNRVKTGVLKNCLPICLVFFVVLGIVAPQPGVFFSELPTQYICVIGLFLHSGLKLKTGEVKDALKSYKAFIWGVICIMCLTPIIGGHLTGLLPYQPYATKDLEPQDNGVFSLVVIVCEVALIIYASSHIPQLCCYSVIKQVSLSTDLGLFQMSCYCHAELN